jgi:hypothetical protein
VLDPYPISFSKEIRYGPFTSVFLLFILVYKNLLFLYDMREFVLVLVAGRSSKRGFLLSVSRVLLRVIPFREDISSIADISIQGDSRGIAFMKI